MAASLLVVSVVLSVITQQWSFLLATLPIIALTVVLGVIRYVNAGRSDDTR